MSIKKAFLGILFTSALSLIVSMLLLAKIPHKNEQTKQIIDTKLQNQIKQQSITSILKTYEIEQTKSAEKFITAIDDVFDIYIANVHHVVENKPKWRVIWNTLTFDEQEAEELMLQHFNNIFKDSNNTLDLAIETLNYECELNQNKLYANIGVEIKNNNLQLDTDKLKEVLKKQNNNIISTSNKALLVSIITAIATEELMRIGLTATFTTITASTTTGATGGSFAPGIGNTIGVIVGFIGGITIDCFIEKKYNQQLEIDIINALKNSRNKIKQKYKEKLYQDIKKQMQSLTEITNLNQ